LAYLRLLPSECRLKLQIELAIGLAYLNTASAYSLLLAGLVDTAGKTPPLAFVFIPYLAALASTYGMTTFKRKKE
jgi:hypothetical protein